MEIMQVSERNSKLNKTEIYNNTEENLSWRKNP